MCRNLQNSPLKSDRLLPQKTRIIISDYFPQIPLTFWLLNSYRTESVFERISTNLATREFPLDPQPTRPVQTRFRRIESPLPHPESVAVLQELRSHEPRSMGGQPPVIWDQGEGCLVRDPYGNQWIDFSSGVLVTSAGHNHPRIVEAITRAASQNVYHAYCFPTDIRARLTARITKILPDPLARVFLLTTGSEATECAIKLAKTRALRQGGPAKRVIVGFDNAFHGRTMGAQLAGGIPGLKTWIGCNCADFVQVPYPDGFRCPDTSFDVFLKALEEKGVRPDQVAGVITETYQGCNATIMPEAYARELRQWCVRHGVTLIFDEVQAGFGRTGRMFGFEHCGIVPDVACFGKGISGGMPLSAVVGTEEIMSLYGPGEMTSTHSANPVCAAAALANINIILEEDLTANAARLEPILLDYCRRIQESSGGRVGRVDGKGLVAAIQFTQPGTTNPDPDLAFQVVKEVVEQGVLLFAPVGVGGGAIKLNPPLIITEDMLREGLEVILETTARLAC